MATREGYHCLWGRYNAGSAAVAPVHYNYLVLCCLLTDGPEQRWQ